MVVVTALIGRDSPFKGERQEPWVFRFLGAAAITVIVGILAWSCRDRRKAVD
jgi:hypothetical protein